MCKASINCWNVFAPRRCRPGGEAGSSLKLAHNFYGVGIRYYGKRLTAKSAGNSLHSMMLGTLIGERRKPSPARLGEGCGDQQGQKDLAGD